VIKRIFDVIVFYLPVFVPFALAMFSVLTRILSETMERSLRSFLKIYNEIVLGIFSFLIWALITYLQTGQIGLNADLVLSFPIFIILLLIDLLVLVVAAVISRQAWKDSARHPYWTGRKIERTVDSAFIMICTFFFVLPIFLTSPAKMSMPRLDRSRYTVLIPYTDPTLGPHLGRSRWGTRKLCDVESVEARNENEARDMAINKFKESDRSLALFADKDDLDKTLIITSLMMVRQEP